MNDFAHIDLVRIHQAEMHEAAERHRLVAAIRRTERPHRSRGASLRTALRLTVLRRVRVLVADDG